jgi:hypothetical protein
MRIHFIVTAEFAELAAKLPDLELGRNFPYWVDGRFVWSAQSWLVLRQFREGFTFGTHAKAGIINFGHSSTWRGIGPRVGEFRVGVRADFPRVFDVDFEILQNPAVELSSTQAYLPYWPIPGQIQRRSSRRGLQTIAYAGFIGPRNLAIEIRNGDWRVNGLEGLDFVVVPPEKWHEMSEIDLLVAIRSMDRRTYPAKPPSKLFNAWRSSIPLVGGFDSAFSAVGRPGIDYVRVGSDKEFKRAIVHLREDAGYYDRIAAEGRKRAADVSHERLAQSWLDVFDHRIAPVYQRWLQRGGPRKSRGVAQAADRARDLVSALKAQLSPNSMFGAGKSR